MGERSLHTLLLSLFFAVTALPTEAVAQESSEEAAQEEVSEETSREEAVEDSGGDTASDIDPAEGLRYTVRPGDTLSDIAVRFEVEVEDLVRWNGNLNPDRIRDGQVLRILNGQRRVEHEVEAGDALARLATRYEVEVAEILNWNPGLRPDRIRVGHTLIVYTHVPESRSQSVGTPQRGHLEDGEQLPQTPAIYVRTPARAWGTSEAVQWIVDAYEAVREADDSTPRVEVHDLSRERGGPLHGHRSHRSGRDADIAYYQRDCRRGLCSFRRIDVGHLDAARQWQLFERWLREDRVEAIFVDHALQRALYEEARRSGATPGELSRWFQYPRPPDDRYGVIRHHPRHDDHFHVRFICHETDPECR